MISIIIPTLNEEKVIGKTLLALRQFNVCDYEIIVSDGHSTDKTVEIAKKYADLVVTHDGTTRQTIGQGRNAGAAKAKGEFLIFLDSDVEIPDINNFFTKALELFETDEKLVGLTVFLKVFPEHATLADKFFFQLANTVHYIANNWFHTGSASGEFQMIRAKSFNQLSGYNEKMVMGEDNNMFARLTTLGKTRLETGLHVLHTSRRAHEMGWLKLMGLWQLNNIFFKLFKKSFSKEWKVIR